MEDRNVVVLHLVEEHGKAVDRLLQAIAEKDWNGATMLHSLVQTLSFSMSNSVKEGDTHYHADIEMEEVEEEFLQ